MTKENQTVPRKTLSKKTVKAALGSAAPITALGEAIKSMRTASANPAALLPAPAASAAATPAPASAPPAAPAAATKKVEVEPEVAPPNELLLKILTSKRSHLSKGDTDFRLWLFAYIKGMGVEVDIISQGTIRAVTNKKSTTMFSCHVDTCHTFAESDGTKQELYFDPSFGHIILADKGPTGPRCLGADDGAGIYLMLNMIHSKIPGTYLFHTGEEKGGIGSRAVLNDMPKWLDNFDRCIAFDRAGTGDVIVTQGGQQCASHEAGSWLADALNQLGFNYAISHRGSFTDSKVYSGHIPECFNLSVGYESQHGPDEYQDLAHLEALKKAVLRIKWDKMPTKRPLPPEVKPYTAPAPGASARRFQDVSNRGGYSGNAGRDPLFNDGDEDEDFLGFVGFKGASAKPAAPTVQSPFKGAPANAKPISPLSILQELENYTYEEVLELVENEPTIAADAICLLLAKYKSAQQEAKILTKFFQ